MNTTEAMTYIEQRNALGSVLGLDNIKELLKRLGDPQDQCRVVHIAGTNGKGSILAYMDQVLQVLGEATAPLRPAGSTPRRMRAWNMRKTPT